MSRIGRSPITIPSNVEMNIDGLKVTMKGAKGTLDLTLPALLNLKESEGKLEVGRTNDQKQTRALHGLHRALLQNMVIGVTEGYERWLSIVGVSFQAALAGNKLTLKLGFANDIVLTVPAGVNLEVPNPTTIRVHGTDKQKVGEFAAKIRSARKPEPYKGKGIRYRDEHVVRKQGKSFVGSD